MSKREFIQDIHYYLEENRVVFTALFLSERGMCCGNGCKNCPYSPKHQKNNKKIDESVARLKDP